MELGDPLALVPGLDQRSPTAELTHDLEHLFGERLGGSAREQPPADLEVDPRALRLGQEQIGGLVDAIVGEAVDPPVGGPGLEQQVLIDRRPQRRRDLVSARDRQRGGVDRAAQARRQLERHLGLARQRVQPASHQLGDVVGIALGADPGGVPPPAVRVAIEPDQVLVVERGQELDREERVAAGLVADEARERRCLVGRCADGVGDQLTEILRGQRLEHDVADPRAALPRRFERAHRRVRPIDLVVAIRADDQQVAGVAVGQEVGEEREARGVRPLHVVDEHRQRVIGRGARREQPAEHPTEPRL